MSTPDILKTIAVCIVMYFILINVSPVPVYPESDENCHLLASNDWYICTDTEGNVAYRPAIHPPKK